MACGCSVNVHNCNWYVCVVRGNNSVEAGSLNIPAYSSKCHGLWWPHHNLQTYLIDNKKMDEEKTARRGTCAFSSSTPKPSAVALLLALFLSGLSLELESIQYVFVRIS